MGPGAARDPLRAGRRTRGTRALDRRVGGSGSAQRFDGARVRARAVAQRPDERHAVAQRPDERHAVDAPARARPRAPPRPPRSRPSPHECPEGFATIGAGARGFSHAVRERHGFAVADPTTAATPRATPKPTSKPTPKPSHARRPGKVRLRTGVAYMDRMPCGEYARWVHQQGRRVLPQQPRAVAGHRHHPRPPAHPARHGGARPSAGGEGCRRLQRGLPGRAAGLHQGLPGVHHGCRLRHPLRPLDGAPLRRRPRRMSCSWATPRAATWARWWRWPATPSGPIAARAVPGDP